MVAVERIPSLLTAAEKRWRALGLDNIEGVLSMGFEVRGNSFIVDASLIQPTCDEIYAAVLTGL